MLFRECLAIASRCESLTEWDTIHQPSYKFACKKNWQQKIAKRLGWPTHYWQYKECLEVAVHYDSLNKWRLSNYPSYRAASRKNWQHKIAKKLGWDIKKQKPYYYWTFERCLKMAKKFKTPNTWRKGHCASYQAAWKEDWHKRIYNVANFKVREMKPRNYWTYERCYNEAEQYLNLSHWKQCSSYQAAYRKGWHKKIISDLWD